MGGQIATYLAARLAPQRVQKFISVDGVVTGKLSDRVEKVTRLLVVVGEKIPSIYNLALKSFASSKPLANQGFKVWFYKPEELPFYSWELDRKMAINPAIAFSTPKAWDSINDTNLTQHLKNITSSTLVIFGKQDGTVPVEQAHLFKEQLPSSQLVIIDNCGHFPMYEKFDEYITSLKTFLKET